MKSIKIFIFLIVCYFALFIISAFLGCRLPLYNRVNIKWCEYDIPNSQQGHCYAGLKLFSYNVVKLRLTEEPPPYMPSIELPACFDNVLYFVKKINL